MERLTLRRTWEEASEDLRNELGYKYIWMRLNQIEDILCDTYDLDRLRQLLNKDTEMREVSSLCGKLIVLCDQPKEWRMKLFRRHRGAMIGDYMGTGYPFVDAFNRIFEEFEGTASEGAYQEVRKAVDREIENQFAKKGGQP